MNIIIDYGLGNLSSVQSGFNRAGIETKISRDKEEIRKANSIILPGVGAYKDAMGEINRLELAPLIREHVEKGKYLLGICLGMQLLYEEGFEYGRCGGLGIIEGSIEYLDVGLKMPHMGWNNLKFNKSDPILKYVKEDDHVYFVHSYYAKSSNKELLAFAEYEKKIPAIVRDRNVYGIQFHPEKSGEVGLNILKAYGEVIV